MIMKRVPRLLWVRLGRRGAMLLLLGIVHVLIGVGVWVRPPVTTPGSFLTLVPEGVQSAGWIVSGLLGAIWAFRRRDSIGWLALYVMPTIRFISYAGAWLVWVVTTGVDPRGIFPNDGSENAWYTAVLHVPLILAVIICSGWREYEPEYPHEFDERP